MAKKKKTKKKLQAGEKSPAQKAADTMRKKRLDAAAKKKTDNLSSPTLSDHSSKPDIERPDVKVTPYPRTGNNKGFEAVLDEVGVERGPSPESKPATAPGPATGDEILSVADVAEWVAWPFMLWAQSNDLPGLAISSEDAISVAGPLTSILNRHGASRVLPPDVIDGLKAGARLTPIMGDRVAAIKTERARRAAGGGDSHDPTPFVKAQRSTQGGQATKPKEV